MATQFVVAPGGSILPPRDPNSGRMGSGKACMPLMPGTIIDRNNWPKVAFEAQLKSGHLIEQVIADDHRIDTEGAAVANPPGVDKDALIMPSPKRGEALPREDMPVMSSGSKEPAPLPVVLNSTPEVEVPVQDDPIEPVAEGTPVTQVSSIWTVDPTTLDGMEIEELNVKIKELDPDEVGCDTVEEAVAFLSQDYVE